MSAVVVTLARVDHQGLTMADVPLLPTLRSAIVALELARVAQGLVMVGMPLRPTVRMPSICLGYLHVTCIVCVWSVRRLLGLAFVSQR